MRKRKRKRLTEGGYNELSSDEGSSDEGSSDEANKNQHIPAAERNRLYHKSGIEIEHLGFGGPKDRVKMTFPENLLERMPKKVATQVNILVDAINTNASDVIASDPGAEHKIVAFKTQRACSHRKLAKILREYQHLFNNGSKKMKRAASNTVAETQALSSQVITPALFGTAGHKRSGLPTAGLSDSGEDLIFDIEKEDEEKSDSEKGVVSLFEHKDLGGSLGGVDVVGSSKSPIQAVADAQASLPAAGVSTPSSEDLNFDFDIEALERDVYIRHAW